MVPREIVESYFTRKFKPVFWPQIGDTKGPTTKNWETRQYTLDDYQEGNRVGILLGTEVEPGKYLHDIDVDWQPGLEIAKRLLPDTYFIFGRQSKRFSHFFYTLPEALPIYKYCDIGSVPGKRDGITLIEFRGTKIDGGIGHETMVPPSVWSKNNLQEPLIFVRDDGPSHIDAANELKQRCCLAAIGMLLAKHLGVNGFGHDVRLAWAGFLLRASILPEDLILMGRAMSSYTNNLEEDDVRTVVESTAERLGSKGQKIKGGPALAKILGQRGKEILSLINEWLGRDSDFIRSEGKILKDNQENVKRALILQEVELSFNGFSKKMLIERSGGPKQALEDREVTDLWLKIDEEHKFRPSSEFFEKVIKRLAWSNEFHPVKDYLAGLEWDGVPRIDTWLHDYGGAEDNEYLRAVSGIVLVAGVRRIRQPGCKYDEMLVLESGQGLDKSSALRALCARDDWFSDDLPLNIEARQLMEATLGKWIIEASDLAGKKKTEIEQLKAMLSRQIDGPARMAYAHFPVEQPRQFILVGTTNSFDYLTDPTGARRFWPVEIRRFNALAIARDRDQLWAEAAQRDLAGESIRLPEHLWVIAGLEQEKRRQVDAWEDDLSGYIENTIPEADGKKRILSKNVWGVLLIEKARQDRLSQNRIGDIMHRLGMRHSTIRDENGKPASGWVSVRVEQPFLLPDGTINKGRGK